MDQDVPNQGYVAPDLFMGLAAILVLILAVISTQEIAHESKVPTAPQISELLHQANEADQPIVILDQLGVSFLSPEGSMTQIPTDHILDTDFGSIYSLAPLTVILDGAGETSFLLDAALAASGVREVRRVRVLGLCASLEIEGIYAKCGPDGE